MKILIISLLIYIFSVLGAYRFIQLIHYHPKGRWYNIRTTSTVDVFATFCPIINTILSVNLLCGDWKDDKYIKGIEFFKPKQPFKDEKDN